MYSLVIWKRHSSSYSSSSSFPFPPFFLEHLSHSHSVDLWLVSELLSRTFAERVLIATLFPCGRVGSVHESSEMSQQPKLRPKLHISGYSRSLYDLGVVAPMAGLEALTVFGEERREQRVFRVKRKHVLKACDRCRVKKTKVSEPVSSHTLVVSFSTAAHANQCDGKQPCNRCSANNHPCLFRDRKATQAKVYSRG